MAKAKSDTVNTVERATQLLEIVRRIPEHGYITCREMQDQLREAGMNVPLRKLQRYLESIVNTEYFHVECNAQGKPYGYRKTTHVLGLDGVHLTARDCLLLRLAQEHLKYQMPPRLTLGLKPLFDQARTYLSESKNGSEKKWLSKIAFVSNSAAFDPPTIRNSVFEAVSRSLFEETALEVTYFSGNAQETKKKFVHPLGIVEQDVRIYLVCTFDGYEDVRQIDMHRIKSAKQSSLALKRPAKFNLNDYVKANQTFNYDRGRWVELSFKFKNPLTKLNLEETPFSGKGQSIQALPKGQGWLLKAVVRDSRLIDGWISMWKDDAGITCVQKREVFPK